MERKQPEHVGELRPAIDGIPSVSRDLEIQCDPQTAFRHRVGMIDFLRSHGKELPARGETLGRIRVTTGEEVKTFLATGVVKNRARLYDDVVRTMWGLSSMRRRTSVTRSPPD